MELVVVERVYEEPLTDEAIATLAERLGPCFSLRRITHVTSYFSRDRRRAVCVYEAPDAATVRDAHDHARHHYVRIWSADETSSRSD